MWNLLPLLTDAVTENPEAVEEVTEEAFNLAQTLNDNPGVTAAICAGVVALIVIAVALFKRKKR